MAKKDLVHLSDLENIADELDEQQLIKIGQDVLTGFTEDQSSSKDWLTDVKKVLELASLKAAKKSYPLPTSANIKLPIITEAAVQFSSRVYPEIIKDGRVVKGRVIGKDDFNQTKADQAERVASYMNYQLIFKSCEWEQDLDKLLMLLPLVGFLCKKTYYDPYTEEVKSIICDYEDLVINSKTKSLYEADRISHVLHMSVNDLLSNVRYGVFCEKPVQELIDQNRDMAIKPTVDVIEQHCKLDLDGDDFDEPYIVWVLKDSGKVLRILARYTKDSIDVRKEKVCKITADEYFTDFHFMPSPKGEFQGVGFGLLLLHITETSNTLLNMITDSGQLANLRAGYIDARAKIINDGNSSHDPGELKVVKTTGALTLKDAVHPIQFAEPSSVLYQVLGLLIQSAKNLSSSTEVLTGQSSPENVKSGAMMALIEQGVKVFTAIQKRQYRSLTEEYKKIFKLNAKYLDPSVEAAVLNDKLALSNKDFDLKRVDVIPVADPNMASDVIRASQAQFLLAMITSGLPGLDPLKAGKRVLESTNIPDVESLLLTDEQIEASQQQPNPEIIKIQAEIEAQAQDLNIRGEELELKKKQFQLDAIKTNSEIILNLAKADQAQSSTEIDKYNFQLKALQTQLDHLVGLNDKAVSQAQHLDYLDQADRQHQDEMLMREIEVQNAQQNQGLAGSSSE